MSKNMEIPYDVKLCHAMVSKRTSKSMIVRHDVKKYVKKYDVRKACNNVVKKYVMTSKSMNKYGVTS